MGQEKKKVAWPRRMGAAAFPGKKVFEGRRIKGVCQPVTVLKSEALGLLIVDVYYVPGNQEVRKNLYVECPNNVYGAQDEAWLVRKKEAAQAKRRHIKGLWSRHRVRCVWTMGNRSTNKRRQIGQEARLAW